MSGLHCVLYHSPVYTADSARALGLRPPLEARLMDIVPTSGFAPDDVLSLGIEFHEADRAVALDRLSLAGVVIGRRVILRVYRSSLEDLSQFLSRG